MMTSSNGNIFRATGPLCGNSPVTGGFPSQRPLTRSFDVFFDFRLNKRLSKPSWRRWFETPSRSLWRQRNDPEGFIVLDFVGVISWVPDDSMRKMQFLYNVEILRALRFKSPWPFLKCPPEWLLFGSTYYPAKPVHDVTAIFISTYMCAPTHTYTHIAPTPTYPDTRWRTHLTPWLKIITTTNNLVALGP